MWPFRKKSKVVETEVNAATYTQWLRAHRPPWNAFFSLPHVAREHLAALGDAYLMDIAIAFGHALADPVAAQAGAQAAQGDEAAEEALAKQAADGLLSRMARRPAQQAPARTAGVLGRKDAAKRPFP